MTKKKKKKKERRQNGGGGIKYTKQLPRPSKNILVWEFTKLCIRTYERGKAPCIYKIFCLGGSSCEVSENITTV